jgi:hypothetical protein
LGKKTAVGLVHPGSDQEPPGPIGRQVEVRRDDEPATGLQGHTQTLSDLETRVRIEDRRSRIEKSSGPSSIFDP